MEHKEGLERKEETTPPSLLIGRKCTASPLMAPLAERKMSSNALLTALNDPSTLIMPQVRHLQLRSQYCSQRLLDNITFQNLNFLWRGE